MIVSNVAVYEATHVRTGTKYVGTAEQLGFRINCAPGTIATCKSSKKLVHNTWEITRCPKTKIPKEITTYEKQMVKRLRDKEGRIKCLALWDAYTSGRSDLWTLTEIASEFSVSIKDVKKVLKEEGKI